MKTLQLTAYFLLLTICCQAQFVGLGTITQEDCNGNTIETYQNWEAYQTLDNTWQGERDSTVCINIALLSFVASIQLDEVDASRPVFFRYRGEEVALNDDALYMLRFSSASYGNMLDFDNTDFCNADFCHGSLIGIEIPAHPDSAAATDVRWYNSQFDIITNTYNYLGLSYTHCIPTEYFDEGNVLKEIILKFVFDETANGELDISNFGFEQQYDSFNFEDVVTYTDQFDITTDSWGGGAPLSVVVEFPESEYPDHVEYIDLVPSPNVDTVSTVTLTIDEYTHLIFQPFTDFRGGLIAGSDSIRHALELVNNGADFCLISGIVELVFDSKDAYVHNGGKLDFRGKLSCLRFNEGASFVIGEGTQMTYGKRGQGTLALLPGSNTLLKTGAYLDFQGRLVILDNAWQEAGKLIEIDVLPFTSIVFSEHAYIENMSRNQASKVQFNMLGGHLDLSGFDDEDMQHVIVKHPEAPVTEGVDILGNPLSQFLELRYHAEGGRAAHTVLDMNGKMVHNTISQSQFGLNYQRVDLSALNSGMYFLMSEIDGVERTQRFVKY